MGDPKVFTVEEAEALIPSLSHLVGQQFVVQSDIERGIAELAERTGKLPRTLDDDADDDSTTMDLKASIRARLAEYQRGWAEVEKLGAVVKDPRLGLIDFYGRVDGRLVWLCWRYGEEALDWYHELDAGFSGRRPLRGEKREQLLN